MDKCFAENKGRCTALKIKECEECSFFKTKEEAEEGRMKAIERIDSLNKERRDHINEIYYGLKLEV